MTPAPFPGDGVMMVIFCRGIGAQASSKEGDLTAIPLGPSQPSRPSPSSLARAGSRGPSQLMRRANHFRRDFWHPDCFDTLSEGLDMFDSAIAFERYRLEVVRRWPDSAVKDKLLASIEFSLRRNGPSRELPDKYGVIGNVPRQDGRPGS